MDKHNEKLTKIYEEFAELLQGTCQIGDPWLSFVDYYVGVHPAEAPLLKDFNEDIKDEIVSRLAPECEQCGWYCYQDEVSDNICDECHTENANAEEEEED